MTVGAVVGYVEAVTGTQVLGWAWAPGAPDAALDVELRLGDAVLARARADRPRDDLRANGVGDGGHAFDLPIDAEHRARAGELAVVALLPDGTAVALGAAPAPDGVAERLTRIQSVLATLVGSQRVLHRNVQSLLMAARGTEPRAAAQDSETALAARLDTLETHLMRLDEHLARLAEPAEAPRPRARVLVPVALALVATAAASGYALVRAVAG
jgi:hypothetical protein